MNQRVFVPSGPLRVDLPAWEGSYTANETIKLKLSPGPTFDRIDTVVNDAVGGRTIAELRTDILILRVLIGSKIKYELSGAQHIAREEFYRTGSVSPGNNGVLPLTFARPWMELGIVAEPGQRSGLANHLNEDGPAYGTLGEAGLTVEIVWAAGHGATSVASYAKTRPAEPLGRHITVGTHGSSKSGTGVDQVQDFDLDVNWDLYALHVVNGNISDVELLAEESTFLRLPVSILHQDLIDAGRTVQTGYTHIDFCHRNRHGDALNLGMRQFRQRYTFTVAPGDYEIIYERAETQAVRQVAA